MHNPPPPPSYSNPQPPPPGSYIYNPPPDPTKEYQNKIKEQKKAFFGGVIFTCIIWRMASGGK